MEVIKVKPWGKGQGDYVLINAADFDPEKHQKFDDEKKGSVRLRKAVTGDLKE